MSNRILPEAAFGDELYAVMWLLPTTWNMMLAVVEIIPKHLLQILGPSNRLGPFSPLAEAVKGRASVCVGKAVETSDV
jgi:hypothetical protein